VIVIHFALLATLHTIILIRPSCSHNMLPSKQKAMRHI